MEEQNKNGFKYTYSAKQQQEIEDIRKKYLSKTEDKMEQLRRLDNSVTKKATAVSLIFGIVGTLLMGIGMCCAMVWDSIWLIPGIFIGLFGIVVLSLAYPVYKRITETERKKIAPEILRLTDELMK